MVIYYQDYKMTDSVPVLLSRVAIHCNILPYFSKDQVLYIKKTTQNQLVQMYHKSLFSITSFKSPGGYHQNSLVIFIDSF